MYFSKLNIKYLDTFFKFTALKSNQKTKKQKTKVLKNIHVILLAIPFFQILMSLLITIIIKSNSLTNIKMSPIHQRAKKLSKTFNDITCI